MEFYPDKVLFGTAAFAFGPEVDWGEIAWLSNTSARQALALALTAMMVDREITRERGVQLAGMVLRAKPIKLYGVPKEFVQSASKQPRGNRVIASGADS